MAATFSTSNIFTELVPNAEYKELVIITPDTFQSSTDNVQITLTDYGLENSASISGVFTVQAYETSGSHTVLRSLSPLTTILGTVLTISCVTGYVGPTTNVFRVVGKGA